MIVASLHHLQSSYIVQHVNFCEHIVCNVNFKVAEMALLILKVTDLCLKSDRKAIDVNAQDSIRMRASICACTFNFKYCGCYVIIKLYHIALAHSMCCAPWRISPMYVCMYVCSITISLSLIEDG